jgi:glycosyltransferase involved in cell wall biosynthesis
MIINIIQDLATPHNNVLISKFKKYNNIKINLWYTKEVDKERYPWTSNITHEHYKATLYGNKFNLKFLKYIILHPKEKYIVVGWMNNNTRLLHFIFFILRRKFNHWTDFPNPEINKFRRGQNIFRSLSYLMLKYSKCNVFCVGKSTMDYFVQLGFKEDRIINLPIFVEVENELSSKSSRRDICEKFNLPFDKFLIVGGSRLIYEKGFDLLIESIALINVQKRSNLFLVIVGSGTEKNNLNKLIKDLNLTDRVKLIDWMSIFDFKTLISSSDLFIQSSRFDSYGGTILAMSLGVPVIGSKESGAAFDRIIHGENGFLYNANDISTLSNFICILYDDPNLKNKFAYESLKTASKWPPELGAKIIIEKSI